LDEPRKRILSVSENTEPPRQFELSDICDFIQKGVQVMVDDEVTKRFDAEEIRCWNLLTRNNRNYHFTSWKLMIYWVVGFMIRFYLLFPIRMAIFVFGMTFILISMSLVGLLNDGPFKRWLYEKVSITSFRIMSRSVSAVINYHNEHYKPRNGGICVANHTSPFDVVMLHCDNAYALVGQLHGGVLGFLERALSRATSHVFFDRSEVTDRLAVVRKMTAHISDPKKLPILIFPEGTCINNSAVMMFKKGSFEVASTVYPVALKYDPIFGDPFWNSSRYGFFGYVLRMMTSWAIVGDIWYLPPMTRRDEESAVDFANRVKSAIARQGGLVDLEWDGQLKRATPRPELKQKVQEKFSRKISVNPLLVPVVANGQVVGEEKTLSERKDCDNQNNLQVPGVQ
jgi:glycerol-3-phosphate O-acyltransferase 3/4